MTDFISFNSTPFSRISHAQRSCIGHRSWIAAPQLRRPWPHDGRGSVDLLIHSLGFPWVNFKWWISMDFFCGHWWILLISCWYCWSAFFGCFCWYLDVFADSWGWIFVGLPELVGPNRRHSMIGCTQPIFVQQLVASDVYAPASLGSHPRFCPSFWLVTTMVTNS